MLSEAPEEPATLQIWACVQFCINCIQMTQEKFYNKHHKTVTTFSIFDLLIDWKSLQAIAHLAVLSDGVMYHLQDRVFF